MSTRLIDRVVALVTPAIARLLVTWMRKMEEANPDASSRWSDLRKSLERAEGL